MTGSTNAKAGSVPSKSVTWAARISSTTSVATSAMTRPSIRSSPEPRRRTGSPRARTAVSYLAPDTWRSRQDVDRFTDASSLARNDLGGAVIPKGISTYGWCADTFENPCITGLASYADIHLPGLAQGVSGWSDERASVRFQLPAGTRRPAVRRAAVPHVDQPRLRREPGLPIPGSVGAAGRWRGSSRVGRRFGRRERCACLSFGAPPLLRSRDPAAARFPLSSFTGVDLGDIHSVQIRFDRTMAGAIDVADLNFSAGAS